MSKKKISWVTPDYFLDVDIPIVPNLLKPRTCAPGSDTGRQ